MPSFVHRRRSRALACAVLTVVGALVVLAAAGAPPTPAAACTLYASPTGSDAAAGTAAAPFRTAQRLVDALKAGGTGCLRGGRYLQPVLQVSAGGSAAGRITLTSYPGERATISADYVYVPSTAAFVTISDLTVDGRPYDAPTLQVMATDAVVQGATITNHNLAESCLILGSLKGYGAADRAIVRDNRLTDCGNPANGLHDHGVYVENAAGASITDNVIFHAAAYGVQMYPNAQRTLVARNVIDSSAGGVVVGGTAASDEYAQAYASSGSRVEYNVVSNSRSDYGVRSSWGGGPRGTDNVVSYNCFFQNAKGNLYLGAGGMETFGNRDTDPLYVDAALRDYRLRPESPCMRADGAGDPPPTVALTGPSGGSGFGDYLCPAATADDDALVTQVRFYIDGAPKLGDDGEPYGSCLATTGLAPGRHTVTARAYDAEGGAASSSVVVYRDQDGVVAAGPKPPAIALSAPAGGATFGDTLCPAASAGDDAHVTRVQFMLDGALLLRDDAPPYGSCVPTGVVADGKHWLAAYAYDADGGVATASVPITKGP